MARNQALVPVATNTWTELTGGDATKITWQIVTPEEKLNGVFIRVTATATAPTGNFGLRFYNMEDPEINRTITDYAAGGKRVWAKAIKNPVMVLVSDDSV